MTENKNNRGFELEDFFAATKKNAPVASETLRYKILKTSEQEFHKSNSFILKQSHKSWWNKLFKEFGGFYSVAGYGAVAAVGIIIGFSSPSWSKLILQFEKKSTVVELEFADPFADVTLLYLEE
jgi:hypothetical protein